MARARLFAVAVPVPGLDLLTYSLPEHLETPATGARVLVPLGPRTVTGCVVGPASDRPDNGGAPADVRPIAEVLDDEAYVPDSVLNVALWVADYYLAGPGEAIAAAMPPGAWIESEPALTITSAGLAQFARVGGSTSARPDLRIALLDVLSSGQTLSVAGTLTRVRRLPDLVVDRASILRAARTLQRDGLVTMSTALRGRQTVHKTRRVVQLTEAGQVEQMGRSPLRASSMAQTVRLGARLGVKQVAALEMLSGATDGVPYAVLADRGLTASTLTSLVARGLVSIRHERVEREPLGAGIDPGGAPAGLALTGDQASALATLTHHALRRAFCAVLLHGVTGSGKTELYVRLAEAVLALGRSVLVLVPEIALTPQVAWRFHQSFGRRVAVQHSGLSDGQRYDQWQRIRRGDVDVAIGTRSAVFAPLANLGLVIVDEEHDASYKQDESPRYHGRDVAIVRAERAGALVVLGSATPSLETYRNAMSGRYERIVLERRVLDRPLPAISIVDMRDEYAAEGPDVVLSAPLREALASRLARSEQSLVLLNRRGLATVVFCRQCAAILDCPNCSLSLTVHGARAAGHRARCHFCNYSTVVPAQCVKCAAPYLEQMGFGTQRVEAAIREAFPGARVARLDRDTTGRRGALESIVGRFRRREVDVLVGTQMIAKGHDFPFVTLVGVVSADIGLRVADFRAGERTFQLLTQVAGRAGRGDEAGEAIVQTIHPRHYTIAHAMRQDYPAFFADEIEFRRTMRYPPLVAMVNLIVRGPSLGAALDLASELAGALAARADTGGFRVVGPAPAPYTKLRGEHRAQLFLKGARRQPMKDAIRAALATLGERKRKVTVDVDPVNMM
jgi:primosomal protein N' (replication factor Y)